MKKIGFYLFPPYLIFFSPRAKSPAQFFLAWAGLGPAQPGPARKFMGSAQPMPIPTLDLILIFNL